MQAGTLIQYFSLTYTHYKFAYLVNLRKKKRIKGLHPETTEFEVVAIN